ncbi:ATP-binding cassette domain-containing protein [Pseudaminobacter arsenicus]|uniref:ATP-binding cassette domain-containing protein n=1 Tax=Borborobacter arsenicus TaxID=1851146 RepID=A0A432V038_9HYPH|nr:oligopeptide/dipeptide ABC transporter ATP-binding protein [Pseudaminobacter arsenicus]RUM95530.1 ATP-binding cassette domain-containing protein [Pseudaminobacter arsenicus]
MREVLRVEGLTKHFAIDKRLFGQPRKWVQAVDNVTFGVRGRGTLAIVGESGSGKTTVGRTIARLLKPSSGRILFDGNDIAQIDERSLRGVRKEIQMVFQNPNASLNPRMTVRQLLCEPLIVHQWPKEEHRPRIEELLETVGLPHSYVDRYPHEFSGGQRQRIAIARALAIRPKVIIFDEPVSALDVSVQAQIIQLLDRIQADTGLASIFISHDLSVVRAISDDVVVLYLGKVMEAGPSRELFGSPRHPYTQALISAVPKMHKRKSQDARIVLKGDLPSPANPPSGCRFRTRCWKAQDICATKAPELEGDAKRHFVACHFPN